MAIGILEDRRRLVIKQFLTILILFLILTSKVSAENLKDYVIPSDGVGSRYDALVGYDKDGKAWHFLKIKKIGEDYFLDTGTTSTTIIGSVSAVLKVEEPIWEAQPTIRYAPFEYTISPLGTYSLIMNFGTSSDWTLSIEYITLFRNEPSPIDYLSLSLYVKTIWDGNVHLVLAEELSPGSSGIIKPPKPIGFKDYMRLDLQNKSEGSQKIKGVIGYSYRKYNYAP